MTISPYGRKPKVLIAKVGLDGHDRGAKIISRFLMDAGMEVIYTGIRRTPADVAKIALQEDVDVIGLSSLSGAHLHLFKAVVDELKKNQLDDIQVIGGGIIPEDDFAELKKCGISYIFTPGSPMNDIVAFIRSKVKS